VIGINNYPDPEARAISTTTSTTASGMAPLTAAQLKEHPGFPNVIWDLKPTGKGKIPVAQGRGGPFDISYEIHGTGDICLVVCLIFLTVLFNITSIYIHIQYFMP
jgi:hypothetical protein